MQDLSLHILDIAENSINAGSSMIHISINENTDKNILVVEIQDNGKGMDDEMLKKVFDPFFTTRTTRRVGLGIPLLAQAAQESMGNLDIKTAEGKGTTITATFQYDHIDRKPLGDIEKTVTVLIAGNPGVDFRYSHKRNDSAYSIDTSEIREALEDVPLNDPRVIKYIKDDISEWLNDTKSIILKNI
jgi:anti-sigma regulatory factor (Ser/Thr protein kinase)